ncbi:SDR family oxidoreductase [Variovorax sp. NFACC27]|uniref:SDR family NAD(P)-dependent oxidoreductase n=1 Tax=unclassified Variovorax TaxID=663243 RepID=UPI00089A9DB6|nr:Enoyl-(Acyl carrier protein) reductase [Variovorax sp. NFACC28]SEG35019.1 Enoyl-(Acyl carrier protein) reductase [Variovorax sp. NFACC29]SFD94707.1 Enoyl-(Acyl carrier protein) reductase [Variovorax sp. NFACC26]SFH05690.1 Enoyl-(Acyl carrier protein) reductase [Variovorax sp. NFACC27]
MSDAPSYRALPHVPFADLLDFSGKTAVVTGGGEGIGLAIARRFAEAGSRVVVGDLHPGRCGELAAEGFDVRHVPTDVTEHDQIEGLLDAAVAMHGRIDVFVNNAGIYPLRAIEEIDAAFWDHMFAVNCKAMFFGARAASRRMKAHGQGGAIVNLSSICGHKPMPNHCAYDASKGAVLAMTRSLALALAPHGIRVNSVSPGLTATPGNLKPELFRQLQDSGVLDSIPLRRQAEPFEIASTVLFLASPMASYVTGTDLMVDGGWFLHGI